MKLIIYNFQHFFSNFVVYSVHDINNHYQILQSGRNGIENKATSCNNNCCVEMLCYVW